MQVTTPHPFPASARNRAPCERKGCVQSPASHVLCTLAPLNTHSHITHKDRPRLHSPQAPFAMKGRKWVRERERKRERGKKNGGEEQRRAQWGSEKVERQEGERNHRFVRRWVDCGHGTGHSGTNWEPEGEIEEAEVATEGENRQGYFIIRIILPCADKQREWPLSSRGTGISPLTAWAERGCPQMKAITRGCSRLQTAGKVPVWWQLMENSLIAILYLDLFVPICVCDSAGQELSGFPGRGERSI